MIGAYLIGQLSELRPRTELLAALIVFCLKCLARKHIAIIDDDVIMDVVMVAMCGKHILIIKIKQTITQFLPYQKCLIGRYFPRGEALDYVLTFCSCFALTNSLTDLSKLLACPVCISRT